jgi:hypothetical protein
MIRANRHEIQKAKESIGLSHVSAGTPNGPGTFRAKFQNSRVCGLPESCDASARSLLATARNLHHRLTQLKNRLSISVTSVTICDDRTIRQLRSTFSGKSHVRFVITLAERPVSPERTAVFIFRRPSLEMAPFLLGSVALSEEE